MKKAVVAAMVAGGWSVSVVWVTPQIAILAVVIAGVVYWLFPSFQKWLESWFLSSFSFIASVQKEAIALQQKNWPEMQLPPVQATISCPECNHPLMEDARFCHVCGASQLESFYCCPRCNMAMPDDSHFCPKCRYPVAENVIPFPVFRQNSKIRALRLVSIA